MYPLDIGLVIETKALWVGLHAGMADLPVRVVLEQSDIADWPSFLDKLERVRPGVVLIDITNLRESLHDIVHRIRNTSAAPYVFAVHTAQDPELILKVLRAGASEYLVPPFGDQLHAALERVSAERSRKQNAARPGGRVVGFVSAKGGCGATTIACHTAVHLASRTGQKVLLADFDMDAGMVGFLMKAKSSYTILDAFKNVQRLDPNYWSGLISNGIPNVEILSSPQPPADIRGVTPDQIRFVMGFGRTQYDWLVLDLGRGITEFTFRAIEESDETYLVTTLEIPALHHAKRMIQRLLDSGYGSHRIRLILNRPPKRSDLTLDELKTTLGLPIYSTVADDYAALQESWAEGKLASSDSVLSRQIDDLAVKIAGIETGRHKKKFSLFR